MHPDDDPPSWGRIGGIVATLCFGTIVVLPTVGAMASAESEFVYAIDLDEVRNSHTERVAVSTWYPDVRDVAYRDATCTWDFTLARGEDDLRVVFTDCSPWRLKLLATFPFRMRLMGQLTRHGTLKADDIVVDCSSRDPGCYDAWNEFNGSRPILPGDS